MSVVSSSFRSRVRAGIERPVAGIFGRLGLTPNALTLIGFAIAVVGAYLAATQSWLIAGVVVAFGAVFDLFDGALARATNKVSKFGAFMDSVFDRAGEAVVYIGIAIGLQPFNPTNDLTLLPGTPFQETVAPLLAVTAMAAAFMVSYTRAKSESLGFTSGKGLADVGLAPREIRTAILVIGLLVAAIPRLPLIPPLDDAVACLNTCYEAGEYGLMVALGLITILATVTTIQRILFVHRQSKSSNQEVPE